jgi:phage shock protein A
MSGGDLEADENKQMYCYELMIDRALLDRCRLLEEQVRSLEASRAEAAERIQGMRKQIAELEERNK